LITSGRFLQLLLFLLLILPLVPLLAAWWRVRTTIPGQGRQFRFVMVSLLTGSWLLVLTGALFSDFFGPNFSNRRYAIIYSNWVLSVVSVLLAGKLIKDKSRMPILLSAWLLTLIWSLDAALNAAV
jgi:hypothetical protein